MGEPRVISRSTYRKLLILMARCAENICLLHTKTDGVEKFRCKAPSIGLQRPFLHTLKQSDPVSHAGTNGGLGYSEAFLQLSPAPT